ncbi:hypothetical protein MFU01_74740 [Myxococcus fulvus]|uniref:Uncharacterized protein n=1 Tax=Myxococcus fulvus TaxID=33 RepID=A0A511TE48_MYXFU|nr:hypothetical protein MFU01_74740 [Myxococcus fulvus]
MSSSSGFANQPPCIKNTPSQPVSRSVMPHIESSFPVPVLYRTSAGWAQPRTKRIADRAAALARVNRSEEA